MCYNKPSVTDAHIFPGSSMVEQEAVNFEVTGSSPVRGAINKRRPSGLILFMINLRLDENLERSEWFGK